MFPVTDIELHIRLDRFKTLSSLMVPSPVYEGLADFLEGLAEHLHQQVAERKNMLNAETGAINTILIDSEDGHRTERYYKELGALVKFAVRKYYVQYHLANEALREERLQFSSVRVKSRNIYTAS